MAIVPRGKKFGAVVYRSGERVWLGSFATRAEAEAAESRAKRGMHSETCDEFATRWITDYPRAKESTVRTYEQALTRFRSDFEGTPLTGPLEDSPWAKEKQLRGNDRQIARAWAMSNRHRAQVVRSLYEDALNDGMVESNPFSRLKLPSSKGRKNIVALTPQEVEEFAEIAQKVNGPVMHGAVLTLGFVGLRVSELWALRYSDLDFQKGEVRISRRAYRGTIDRPKNGEPRTVVLPNRASEAIRSIPRRLDTELVFPSPTGRTFQGGTWDRLWSRQRAVFEASLSQARREELAGFRPSQHKGITAHELRHACATYLRELGLDAADCANQLGHEDGGILVSKLYAHPDRAAARQRIRAALRENVTDLREANNG